MTGFRSSQSPNRPPAVALVLAMLTTGAMVAVLVLIAFALDEPLLVPPFATSAAIIASLPQSPVAPPRNVVGGHLVGALCGYVALLLGMSAGPQVLVAVTLAVGGMLAARVLHPPAAATAVIVVLAQPPVVTFLVVLAVASVLIATVGVLSARTIRSFHYPVYWW